jgi:hypothetical protein
MRCMSMQHGVLEDTAIYIFIFNQLSLVSVSYFMDRSASNYQKEKKGCS